MSSSEAQTTTCFPPLLLWSDVSLLIGLLGVLRSRSVVPVRVFEGDKRSPSSYTAYRQTDRFYKCKIGSIKTLSAMPSAWLSLPQHLRNPGPSSDVFSQQTVRMVDSRCEQFSELFY